MIDRWVKRAPTWLLVCVFAAAWFLIGLAVGLRVANAATLEVHGRQANLYGGRLGTARVCADLHLTKPTTAKFTVQGARQFSDYTPDADGSWAQHRTLRLKAGHRRFCRSFTLRYWRLTTAVKLIWRAEVFNAAHAELRVGDETYEADRLLVAARPFPVVTP